MSWNYRVVRHKEEPFKGIPQDDWYGIHEVYYDEDDKPRSVTVNPMHPFGENVGELRSCIDMMLSAFEKPVLDHDGFSSGADSDVDAGRGGAAMDGSGRPGLDRHGHSTGTETKMDRFSITSAQVATLATGEPVDFAFTMPGPSYAQYGDTESLSFTLVPDKAVEPTPPVLQLGGDAGLEGKARAKLSDLLDGIMAGDAAQPAAEALGRILVSIVTARRMAETADLSVHVHNYGTDETNDLQG